VLFGEQLCVPPRRNCKKLRISTADQKAKWPWGPAES